MVDVSMADGALSWLAMVAGTYFADGNVPRRGELPLAGSLVCYRPYECADGWVSLGALEPKFWQAWCRGVGREDLIARQFEGPGAEAHRAVQEIFAGRTRAQWEQFAREHDCCLEPVLELDEALVLRARARARDGRRDRAARVPAAGAPARGPGQARAHARRARPPAGPRARRAHRGGAARGRLLRGRGRRSCCAAAPPPGRRRRAATRRCAREGRAGEARAAARRRCPPHERGASAARAPARRSSASGRC